MFQIVLREIERNPTEEFFNHNFTLHGVQRFLLQTAIKMNYIV